MSYNSIITRANKERKRTDSVVWKGKCVRCGIENMKFGDEIEDKYEDVRCDLREKEETCRSWRCSGRVRWRGRTSVKKAIHLNDIRRR